MKIIKTEDSVIIKNNNLHQWKTVIFFNGIIIFTIFIFFIFIFKFRNIFLFLSLVVFFISTSLDLRHSFYADEEMVIKGEEIIIKYYAWKKPFKAIKMLNNNSLGIAYDFSFKANLKMFFKPNITFKNPDKYRLMKFVSNSGLHSFGYDLSESDYITIQKIISDEREKNLKKRK